MNDRALRYATLGGLALVLVLLVVVLLRVHDLEARFITQGKQLRTLGETTERLRAGGVSVGSSATGPASDIPPGVKVLHPDVQNFLKPKDTHWPPPGAMTSGGLARGWEYGDPKTFNVLLDGSGVFIELIQNYSLLRLAERNVWTDPDAYYGVLAWRIEVTDDSKEFTAYLKRGVKWHSVPSVNLDDPKYAWLRAEREVTAHDLVFTLELITNPQVQSGHWKNYFAELESFKALDDYTFVVRWKKKEYLNLTATVERDDPEALELLNRAEAVGADLAFLSTPMLLEQGQDDPRLSEQERRAVATELAEVERQLRPVIRRTFADPEVQARFRTLQDSVIAGILRQDPGARQSLELMSRLERQMTEIDGEIARLEGS